MADERADAHGNPEDLIEKLRALEAQEEEARETLRVMRQGSDELEDLVAEQQRFAAQFPDDDGMQENARLIRQLQDHIAESLRQASEELESLQDRVESARAALHAANDPSR